MSPEMARWMSPTKEQNQNKTRESRWKTDPTLTLGKYKVAAGAKEVGEEGSTPLLSCPKRRGLSQLPKLMRVGAENPKEENNWRPKHFTERMGPLEPKIQNHLLNSVLPTCMQQVISK